MEVLNGLDSNHLQINKSFGEKIVGFCKLAFVNPS
jgi:hypothetical protein